MTDLYTPLVDAVLLIGPTGSGKSPLGDFLASRGFLGRRSHHLDFGSELRSIGSGIGVSAYSQEEREFILGVLDQGLLLENEHFALAKKIVSLFLEHARFRKGDVLVLNGLPRHVGQAHDLAQIAQVHALIVLDCSAESVFRRIEENTGGDRVGRLDDGRALVEEKLVIFRERTAPLIRHYEKAGGRVYSIEINETTTAGSAYQKLSTLAAGNPPISLVAEPPQG